MSTFTYADSDGKEFTAKDTAENRVSVQNQGYTIVEGFGKAISEVARGADEVMGDHVLSKYSPTMLVPRAIVKGIAGLGDAKTNEEIKSDKLIYEDGDGKQYTATNNPDNIKTLTEQGYKIHDLTTQGARGMAQAFGEQSQNQYLFGIPHMLDTPEEKKRHEELANQNPASNIAGGVTGTVASLLTPGLNMAKAGSVAERGVVAGLGKLGVEGTGLLGKAAIAVGGEAGRGAAYAAPHALAEAVINEDPVKAAKEIGIGIGIGGLFGIGKFGATQAVDKLATKITPQIVNEKANQLLLDQAGLTAAQKVKLPDEEKAVQLLIENGVFAGSKKETAQNIKKLVEESGPGVGKMVTALDKGLEKAIELPKPPGSILGFDYRKLASSISALSGDMVGPLREAEKRAVEDSANQILAFGEKFGNKDGSLAFDKAQELKKIMQGEANYRTDVSGNLNNTRKAIASMTRQEMEDAADRVTVAVGEPQLVEQWGKYKGIFAAGKVLEKAADKVLNAKGDTSSILDIGLHHIGPFKAAGVFAGHFAGPVGAFAGGALGGKADKLLFAYLRENVGTKAALWLKKQANNPNLPSYIAMASSAMLKAKISEIPAAIENMAIRGAVAATPLDPIKKILGEDANGLSKDQQFDKFSQRVIDAHSNPEGTQAHLNDLLGPIKAAHPALGDLTIEDSLKKMEYIYSILPKNPNATPQPFSRNNKWKPTAAEMQDFNKQLAVANDPLHVIEELKTGTLSSKQVATLAYLNPEILQDMRDEITKMAYSGKPIDLKYQQKLNLSILMGSSMVKSLDYVQPLQAAYGAQDSQGANGMPSQPGKGSKGGHPKVDKLPGAKETMAQRISNK